MVAHFVNRLVFCMFADDVGLLPDHMFTRMLRQAQRTPEQFTELAAELFRVMAAGGRVGFEAVAWFNGGLFDDGAALPLEATDIETVLAASDLDWSEIDPSILGTLFERGLDPGKRAQLGAHYTDRDKINQPESHELSKNSAARQASGCVYANSTPSAGAPNAFTHGCVLCREVTPAHRACHGQQRPSAGTNSPHCCSLSSLIEPQSFTGAISKCGSSRQASRCGILALMVAARQGEMLSLRYYCSAIHRAGSEAGPGPVGALLWGLRLLRRGHSHGGLPCLRRKSIPRAPGRVGVGFAA